MLDDAALQETQQAEARVAQLERDLAAARDTYHDAMRRLHRQGGSLREIAAALDLSYQRVHQIVGQRAPGWRSLLRVLARGRMKAPLHCSFCGRGATEVARLIAGPHDHICGDCVGAGHAVTAGADQDDTGPFRRVPRSSGLRCGFCGKQARGRWTLAAAGRTQICSECLDYCETILAEHA